MFALLAAAAWKSSAFVNCASCQTWQPGLMHCKAVARRVKRRKCVPGSGLLQATPSWQSSLLKLNFTKQHTVPMLAATQHK
jgi:hypothetical protein